MTANNTTSASWINLLSKLPAGLIFIIFVNYTLLREMVSLYKEQNSTGDTFKVYTLIAIGVIVVANLIIILSFSFVRLTQEKSKTHIRAETETLTQ